MKLKNKKTGEIKFFAFVAANGEVDDITLAELNEEWQDYEEPNEYYYYIDDLGVPSIDRKQSTTIEMRKNFGNYFASREEAEKACDKLKAWKRLKDKGFRFIDHTDFDDGNITIWGKFNKELDERDVDLLFGGEDE